MALPIHRPGQPTLAPCAVRLDRVVPMGEVRGEAGPVLEDPERRRRQKEAWTGLPVVPRRDQGGSWAPACCKACAVGTIAGVVRTI